MDAVERRKPYFERVLRSGEPIFFEDERLGQWFDNRVYPICDGNGQVVKVALVARDISDRKQAEQALRESEERWRSLVENAPDIVVTVDREGRILFTNRGRFDRPAESYVGQNITDWVLPEARELVRQSIEKVFVEGSTGYFEAPAILSDGSTAWFASHIGPIRRDGEVVAVMHVAHDITERRQVEEIKDNLIRDVSHELRTPLAKMQMSLDLLLELLDQEPINRQRAIGVGQMVFGNVQRQLQTVETILDLSTLESGRIVYERVQISACCADLRHASVYAAHGRGKGVGISSQCAWGSPAHRGRLETVVSRPGQPDRQCDQVLGAGADRHFSPGV